MTNSENTMQTGRPFSERHPRWNFIFGLLLLLSLLVSAGIAVYFAIHYFTIGISKLVAWLSSLASKLDAVIIVALITGGVSIIGVVISSIVAKRIDYKKSRQEYLAQKREDPYGEFVEMIYKIQQNAKNKDSYSQEQMVEDLSRFSKQITLWGSSRVVKKWVEFRGNGASAGTENLFLMEEIMNEMRKDLGLRRVKKGNLLAFFINDIKSVMKNKK